MFFLFLLFIYLLGVTTGLMIFAGMLDSGNAQKMFPALFVWIREKATESAIRAQGEIKTLQGALDRQIIENQHKAEQLKAEKTHEAEQLKADLQHKALIAEITRDQEVDSVQFKKVANGPKKFRWAYIAATQKQLQFIEILGGDPDSVHTKEEAYILIDKLLKKRDKERYGT